MKPLLQRLNERLAQAQTEEERAEIAAERACFLARTGQLSSADEAIYELRLKFGGGQSVRVSSWIMLAEGILMFYGQLSSGAYDRVRRSHEISRSFKLDGLTDLTSAWLAHLELDRSNYRAACDLAQSILCSDSRKSDETWIRLGLVLGDAYLAAGNRSRSQVWYDTARRHAVLIGDRVAQGALMYNRSSFGLALNRVLTYLPEQQTPILDPKLIALEVSSAAAFERVIGSRALSHLSDLMAARAFSLVGQYCDALRIFIQYQGRLEGLENRAHRTPILSDIALCHASLEQLDEARSILETIMPHDYEGLDADDRLVFVGQLKTAWDLIGDLDRCSEYAAALSDVKSQYLIDTAELVAALHRLEGSIDGQAVSDVLGVVSKEDR